MIPGGVVLVQLDGQRMTVEPAGPVFLTFCRLDRVWTLIDRTDDLAVAHRSLVLSVELWGRDNVAPVTLAPTVSGGYVHGHHTVPTRAVLPQPSVDGKTALPADQAGSDQ